MAVIDELIVLLKLDASQFDASQKAAADSLNKLDKVSEKSGKNTRESNKKTENSFKNIRNEIYKLTTAFIGFNAIKTFAADTTRADAALGRLSRNLSISSQDLKAFESVGERYGVSAADMDAAFQHTADVIADFRTRGKIDPEFLFNLGMLQINSTKFFDRATTDVERFKMVQDALNRSIESGVRTREQALRLGMGLGYDRNTITMMLETKGVLDDLIAKQKEMNTVTEADTMLAQARINVWKNLTNTLEGYGRTLLNFLTASMLSKKDRFEVAQEITSEGDQKALPEWMGGRGARQAVSGKIHTASDINALRSHLEEQYGLPKGILAAIKARESGSRTDGAIVSGAGALGPMQFMPATAKAYGLKNPQDLQESTIAAAKLLHDLLQQFHGNLGAALAGYNAGPKAVLRGHLPLETQRYVPGVLARLQGGATSMQTMTNQTHINTVNVNAPNANASEVADILRSGQLSRYNTNLQSMVAQQ